MNEENIFVIVFVCIVLCMLWLFICVKEDRITTSRCSHARRLGRGVVQAGIASDNYIKSISHKNPYATNQSGNSIVHEDDLTVKLHIEQEE